MDQEQYDKIFNHLRTENLPFLSLSDKNYPRYVVKDGLLCYKPNQWPRNCRKVCNVLSLIYAADIRASFRKIVKRGPKLPVKHLEG